MLEKMHQTKFKCIFVIVCLFQMCQSKVIDDLEYSKMPKLFTLDDYRDCLLKPGGLYCVVEIQLMPSTSDLWHQIKNFSSYPLTYYRHDILHKGICVTKKCNVTEEYSPTLRDDQKMLNKVLTECTNFELQQLYELEGNTSVQYCEETGYKRRLEGIDWFYIVILLCIFLMNLMGTTYHMQSKKQGIENPNKLLMSLSIISNWKKLITRSKNNPKSETNAKSFHAIEGMRFLSTFIVISVHAATVINIGFIDNTINAEKSQDYPHYGDNISLVMQTFLCIGSFLMANNFLVRAKKHPITSVWTYFKLILDRFLRFSPVNAIIIGFMCTVYDKLGTGPLWQHIVVEEGDACRRLWWTNLLYINNYVFDGQPCLGIAWYLAVDIQLYCIGTIMLMLMWKFPSIARLLLGILTAIGIILPGVITYANDYYPIYPHGPESIRLIQMDNETYKNVQITIVGNLAGYTVGLLSGCLYYYLEKEDISLAKIKWFRIWYRFVCPLMLCVLLSGALFYNEDYVYDPLPAAIYASLHKFIFAILIASFMLGAIHKCDNITRGIVEWDGFQIPVKLSLCVYLIHAIIQRITVGLLNTPFDSTIYNMICTLLSSITMTYVIASLLYVFVELPFDNLRKLLLRPAANKSNEVIQETVSVVKESTSNGTTNQIENV